MKTAIDGRRQFREHLIGREHPERPERYERDARRAERIAGLTRSVCRMPATAATEEELALCHTAEYLRTARHDVVSGRPYLSTGDTDITPKSWDVAARAVGGVLNAVDAVCRGEAKNAFCAGAPAGPSRERRDAAWASACSTTSRSPRAMRSGSMASERVLIVDWDVHHGNGTQDIFYADPPSFLQHHQWPLYPGTGRADETGEGAGRGPP